MGVGGWGGAKGFGRISFFLRFGACTAFRDGRELGFRYLGAGLIGVSGNYQVFHGSGKSGFKGSSGFYRAYRVYKA